MTLRSGILARTAINSSERPSEKYSLEGSPLVLTNGRTATLLAEMVEAIDATELVVVGRALERNS